MNASRHQKDPNRWYVPPEISVTMAPLVPVVGVSLGSLSFWSIRSGDPTIPVLALAFSLVGVVLLFIARHPLYRQRRFFTFGSRLLDDRHRRLYRWSYRCIALGVLLMIFALAALR